MPESNAGLLTGCTGGVHAASVRVRAETLHEKPGVRRCLCTD